MFRGLSPHTAYKVFEKYDNISKHYQAVAIIRNKIRGSADATLASFNTVLNFKAIIARLDFTFADKRPIYLIEQELSTLRQGGLNVLEFYDLIEKKLSLLTNKTAMTYDKEICQTFNDKYRADALRTFISGLRKPLSDILFASRPSSLPTALAMAQEVEANHERYAFASSFANRTNNNNNNSQPQNYNKRKDDIRQKKYPATSNPPQNYQNTQNAQNSPMTKNPYFNNKQSNESHQRGQDRLEPMDVDPSSSKFRQATTAWNPNGSNFQKREANSDRYSGKKFQKVNYIAEDLEPYEERAELEVTDVEEEDRINFLGETPSYRS